MNLPLPLVEFSRPPLPPCCLGPFPLIGARSPSPPLPLPPPLDEITVVDDPREEYLPLDRPPIPLTPPRPREA